MFGIEETKGNTDEIILDKGEKEGEVEEEAEETTDKLDWESDDNPYKEKYSQSSKEVTETLLPKIKSFENTSTQADTQIATLRQENADLEIKLKDKNPEAYDNRKLHKELTANSQKLAELTENQSLDGFISNTPLASSKREALRSHARANPSQTLEDIWNNTFKAGAEAEATLAEQNKKNKKKSQTESGTGSATSDPSEKNIAGKYTEKEFNKLSVEKRREILVKSGQKF